MEDVIIERAVAIFGMALWLIFPVGLFISIAQQDRQSKPYVITPNKAEDYEEEFKKSA